MEESPLERLAKTHPDLEIWWDSSPLVYSQWVRKMLNSAEPPRRPVLEEQLSRLYNVDAPAKSVFRGCTTNPPLSWQAIQSDPDFWNDQVGEIIRSHPGLDVQELVWLTYKEVVKRGAEMYMPIFEATHGRFGWISGQLDPRLFTETEQMVRDAEELSALSPNVMIKVPASMQGIEVVKILTSKGISTNTTVCFTLPQILASAEAAMEGIKIAEKNRVDLRRWRAVITMMIGRLTEHEVLDLQAARQGHPVVLAGQALVWDRRLPAGLPPPDGGRLCQQDAGLLHARRAAGGRQDALLGCAEDRRRRYRLHLPAVCPGAAVRDWRRPGSSSLRSRRIVPAEVIEKMMKIPYCIQAYDPNGLALEQFNDHPATVSTVEAFSKGFAGLEGYIGERMTARHHEIARQN